MNDIGQVFAVIIVLMLLYLVIYSFAKVYNVNKDTIEELEWKDGDIHNPVR